MAQEIPDLTIERVQLFLLVVMPGIIAIKGYDLFYPPEKRDFGSSLLEAVAYGLINLALWAWPLWELNQKGFPAEHPLWYALGSFTFLVASPALLALFTVWARTWPIITRKIGYPNKTAWDDFFKRKPECWILFHLKNGKMVGGYFGATSYVTVFPHEPEVYVEQVYRVDENGKFVEVVQGTLGMVIRQAECERLEFLLVEEEESNGKK